MHLTSLAEIRSELGFDSMTDINAAIGAALDAAEVQLAAALNTDFSRATHKDTFWVYRPTFMQHNHAKTEFQLSRGFLTEKPIVTTEALTIDPENIEVDLEKGIVRDWTHIYSRAHVVFTYTYGFEATDDVDPDGNPVQYDLTQVPRWLQQAAKLTAYLHLVNSAAINEAGVSIDADGITKQLQALMPSHLRYAPIALHPL